MKPAANPIIVNTENENTKLIAPTTSEVKTTCCAIRSLLEDIGIKFYHPMVIAASG
jgi:hypothetical protein